MARRRTTGHDEEDTEDRQPLQAPKREQSLVPLEGDNNLQPSASIVSTASTVATGSSADWIGSRSLRPPGTPNSSSEMKPPALDIQSKSETTGSSDQQSAVSSTSTMQTQSTSSNSTASSNQVPPRKGHRPIGSPTPGAVNVRAPVSSNGVALAAGVATQPPRPPEHKRHWVRLEDPNDQSSQPLSQNNSSGGSRNAVGTLTDPVQRKLATSTPSPSRISTNSNTQSQSRPSNPSMSRLSQYSVDENKSVKSLASSSSSRPIVAELAKTEEEIAQQVQERLERDMEERLQQEIQERLEQERQTHVVAHAVEIDEDKEASSRPKSREQSKICGMSKCFFVVSAIVVLCLIGGGVGAALALTGSNSDQEETMAPTAGPSIAPTGRDRTTVPFQALLRIIGSQIASDTQVFEEESSIEYQTLNWLANEDLFRFQYNRNFGNNALPSFATIPRDILIERYTLAYFYFASNGSLWTKKFNFLSDGSVCEWYDPTSNSGIFCNEDNTTVVEMWLNDVNIRGTIPTELTLLTSLQQIVLDENSIFGSLPLEFFALTNLEYLSLLDCALSGTIPSEIGNLSSLTYLNFFDNALGGTIPTQIGLLTNLTEISLNFNAFSGSIPTEVGLLQNMFYFDVESNQFNGTIPTEIGSIQGLERLFLEQNKLTGSLPTELAKLSILKTLAVFENQLEGTVPDEYKDLQLLEYVYLEQNEFTGSVDDIFCARRLTPILDIWAIVWNQKLYAPVVIAVATTFWGAKEPLHLPKHRPMA